MNDGSQRVSWRFPRWANLLRPALGGVLLGLPLYLTVVIWLGGSAKTINVGYAPQQPVPYSHALHAGKLGLDCRYCHTTVETATFAALPPTETCMNCHTRIRTTSKKLAPVQQSLVTGRPIPWVKVHDLPDYVYFDHGAHVSAGVGCVECHGRVDKMEVVRTVKPLNMAWCLDCHRHPEPHLRPVEKVTDLAWRPDDPEATGRRIREERGISPRVDCWTCHR